MNQDFWLNELIRRLDGIPLAVELLASTAQTEPNLESILIELSSKHKLFIMQDLFTHSDSEDRNASLHSSFEISIQCRKMTDHARRLLSCLSASPEGLTRSQVDDLLPQQGHAAARRLREVSLAYEDAQRLMTLAPVREYVAAHYPPSRDDLDRIKAIRDPNPTQIGVQP